MESLTEERRQAIGFDEPFENRWWRVETSAWLLMVALLIAGALGVFGRGVLALSHASGPDVAIEYERVVRYQTPTRISVRVPPDDRGTRVFVGRSLLDRLQVQSLMPPALGSEVRPEGVVFLFPAQTTGGVITFTAEPGAIGVCQQWLGLDGHSPVGFRQFILPWFMSTILRAIFAYWFLLFALRVIGRRAVMQNSPFEMILIFLFGGTMIQAVVGEDRSLVNAS
jgi:hypothetical protein